MNLRTKIKPKMEVSVHLYRFRLNLLTAVELGY